VVARPLIRPAAPERTPTTSPGRLGALDLLRFLAASAVVAFHFTARSNEAFGTRVQDVFPDLGGVTALGGLGVELFFVISGFVILMSVWGRSTQDFVASRAARLFPAYWCAVVLTGTVMVAFHPEPVKSVTLSDVLTNLTMVQTAFGVGHVDGVYWTLYVELKFYVLVGLLALVGLTRTRVIAFAVLWPVVGAIASAKDAVFLATLLAPEHAVFFSAGMLMYLIYREGHCTLLWLLVGMQWALAMHYSSSGLVSFLEAGTERDVTAASVMACVTAAFVLVAAATLSPLARLSGRWTAFLGSLTYPLYLVHENWGWIIIRALHPRVGHLPALVIATACVLVAAWAIHRFVERPLGPRLRELVRRGLQPAPDRPAAPAPAVPRVAGGDPADAAERHVRTARMDSVA
jgi:peptidoglycan/LPS O-acetylase OafA/YrhL